MKHRSCLLLLIVFFALTACAQRPSFNSNAPRLSILGDSYSTFEGYLTPDTNAVWYWNHEWDCTDVRLSLIHI